MTLLSRDDIARALSMLASELNARGVSATIQIVGGAALALRHFDRSTTRDIDSSIRFADAAVFNDAASRVANRLGWDRDWIPFHGRRTRGALREVLPWRRTLRPRDRDRRTDSLSWDSQQAVPTAVPGFALGRPR